MTKYGIWTQNAQVLCPECASQIGKGMKMEMRFATGKAKCEHCHKEILVDESLAQEQKLVYAARQASYANSWLSQTGGMCHAAEINFKDFSDRDWCCICTFHVNPADPDEYYWYTEIMAPTLFIEAERDASSIDEILNNIYWMQRNCCHIPTNTDTSDAIAEHCAD